MEQRFEQMQVSIKQYDRSLAWIVFWVLLLYFVVPIPLLATSPWLIRNVVFDIGTAVTMGIYIWSIIAYISRDTSSISLEEILQETRQEKLASDEISVRRFVWLLGELVSTAFLLVALPMTTFLLVLPGGWLQPVIAGYALVLFLPIGLNACFAYRYFKQAMALIQQEFSA
jgi:hypothetical protein